MEKIKLVIWDLDETFWKGTLSEGGITIIPDNIEIVKELARRGIICSISSKNDFSAAKNVLEEAGIWDYFIFPSIDWMPKGESVRRIIDDCQLRAPNVLFIDDNISNRKEVEHYNIGINTISESDISGILNWSELKGKNDSDLSRLKQYKLLEEKAKVRETYSDNHTFLMESDIHIEFISDVINNKERILELINRTNQLNFTKIRLSEVEVESLFNDCNMDNVCIHVIDKFGDYGICGFYSLNKKEKRLVHFLFSCRILNLGVETYVYEKLGCPNIDVVDPVAGQLKASSTIDWIKEGVKIENESTNVSKDERIRLLMLGGCDLEQMCHYLNPQKYEVIKEFNYPNANGIPVHREHTVYLTELDHLSIDEIKEIENLPFCDTKMFDTKLFTDEYDVLVYSVLMNYTHSVYRNKSNGYKIAYGGYMDSKELFEHLGLSKSEEKKFSEKYEYCGLQSVQDFVSDLDWLVTRINRPIVFINGAETEDVNSNEPQAAERHRQMNKALEDFVMSHQDKCSLLDVRKYANVPENHRDTIRHYQRQVYVEMALKLLQMIDPNNDVKPDLYIKKAKISSFIDLIKERVYGIMNHLK